MKKYEDWKKKKKKKRKVISLFEKEKKIIQRWLSNHVIEPN